MNELARQALPWATAAVGGLGTAWAARKVIPKKYRDLFGALGLLGGGVAGYYLGQKASDYLAEPPTQKQLSAPTAESSASDGREPTTNTVVNSDNKGVRDSQEAPQAPQAAPTVEDEAPTYAAAVDFIRDNTNYTDAEISAMLANGINPLDEWQSDLAGDTAYGSGYASDWNRGSWAALTGIKTGLKNQAETLLGSPLLKYAPGFYPFTAGAAAVDVAGNTAGIPMDNPFGELAGYGAGIGASYLSNRAGSALLSAVPKLAPVGSLFSAANEVLGAVTIGKNTADNLRNALSGKTYDRDAKKIRIDLGPNATPQQALVHAAMNNTVRSGAQALGFGTALGGKPLFGALIGGALPIDHTAALSKEYSRFFDNSTKQKAIENANVQRLLGSHFNNGIGKGLMKLFGGGYFENEQDREFAAMQKEQNERAKRINAAIGRITKLLRRQHPELAARVDAGDVGARKEFNRIRARML